MGVFVGVLRHLRSVVQSKDVRPFDADGESMLYYDSHKVKKDYRNAYISAQYILSGVAQISRDTRSACR